MPTLQYSARAVFPISCSNFVKLANGKSVKSCVAYLTKNRLALQLSLLRGSRPKSAKASPRQCTHSAPDVIKIGSFSAELYPNAWTPSERARKWTQYSAEAYIASSRIITSLCTPEDVRPLVLTQPTKYHFKPPCPGVRAHVRLSLSVGKLALEKVGLSRTTLISNREEEGKGKPMLLTCFLTWRI